MNMPIALTRQRGVAAVELALVIIFLLLLVAGIVEFGRAFWYYDALTKATRDGARMLSVADRATFTSGTFIGDAKDRVVHTANAANVKPALTSSQVSVTCLDASFNAIGCASGAGAPANVRVAISGYSITIGGMIPFLSPTGGSPKVYSGVALAPQTTMRYMID
ncbi:MAG TPA: TadE/TadG family type IV pilus assembly protein [Aromatoleum sp.]|uniref:TadE/TadG family type IV pilus assembly protein n=1 Tax=Aromatoleum sp. TaxID=2307007 RepID=UPI002B4A44D4|nr:TadE/TadG family type IV pilus assembly protein [Aromatoleum sp.]HJV26053.1 TadE/TadG family type IV pilus assembly protein [Aromatoleum sp.]